MWLEGLSEQHRSSWLSFTDQQLRTCTTSVQNVAVVNIPWLPWKNPCRLKKCLMDCLCGVAFAMEKEESPL